MKNIDLTLHYWKDGDWFVGQLVEIPGVMSQGETLEALQENIEDAYRLVLSERKQALSRQHRRAKSIPILVHA
ncbi:MAG: type II toxin-antitoxin system HicB family antitoxin [Nitrospira sp. CG24E]|nr:MAG: type II toxin-antitoxin system HicB family antitoxin [Nitrospira sp. CG24E]